MQQFKIYNIMKSIKLLSYIVILLILFTTATPLTWAASTTNNSNYIMRKSGFGFSIEAGYGRAGSLKILYLSGNAFDRGYEYGYLAFYELTGLFNWAYNMMSQVYGITPEEMRAQMQHAAEYYKSFIPEEYLKEMEGVAEGYNSYQVQHVRKGIGYNLTYLDILTVNTFVDFSCTGAVISGNLTSDGMVIIGTTIDAPPVAPYFVYVIEDPDSGHAVAYYTAAGSLYQNGMNEVGLGLIEHGVYTWKNAVGMPEMIRDRYVAQYADNVSSAISLFEYLYQNYNFSGYGDAVQISDAEGNIATVEVSPFRLKYIVNPDSEPTWPNQDPFVKESNVPEPTNYVFHYVKGYDNVLQGRGWIVRQGIYTLHDMIVGLPGYPSTWEEATTSGNYSWIWEDTRGYMLAHFIYDAQTRGEKLGLKDMLIASRLPLIGDAPHDDGAFWAEPQIGSVLILKGQSSFAQPIYLQTFYPVKTYKIVNITVVTIPEKELKPIIELAREIKNDTSNLPLLSSGQSQILNKIQKVSSDISTLINGQITMHDTFVHESNTLYSHITTLIYYSIAILILVIIVLIIAIYLVFRKK